MEFYGYILLLIITLIFLFKGLYIAKDSPCKIKIIALVAIIFMLLRYIVLLVLFIINNIKYLYMLKFLFFTNIIAVPIIALCMFYIFMRHDGMNFSYNFICAFILILLYCVVIYRFPIKIESLGAYGYTMFFNGNIFIHWTYILLNTIILFVSICFINRKGINKVGMNLIIVSSTVTIAEMLTWIMGMKLCQELIVGDIFWIITLLYGLSRVKKKK